MPNTTTASGHAGSDEVTFKEAFGPETSVTLQRPEGMTDGRWEELAQRASLMLTGHMPWCNDHDEDEGDPDKGLCQSRFETGGITVVVHNGTLDGSTAIDLHTELQLDELTPREAGMLAAALDCARRKAKLWNTGSDRSSLSPRDRSMFRSRVGMS